MRCRCDRNSFENEENIVDEDGLKDGKRHGQDDDAEAYVEPHPLPRPAAPATEAGSLGERPVPPY